MACAEMGGKVTVIDGAPVNLVACNAYLFDGSPQMIDGSPDLFRHTLNNR